MAAPFSVPAENGGGIQQLWQTNSAGDDLHIIDVATQRVLKRIKVGPQPHGIAAPDYPRVVYVAIENFQAPLGELIWINPRTHKITHRLTIGPKPNQIACTPDGRWVYVPCNDGHYWVIDAHEKKVAKKIQTGGRPHNTQCSRDGRFMYLSPMGAPKRVTVVDVKAGHKVVGEIPFADSVRPPALAADNKRFFQHVDGLIGFQVADISKRQVTATIRHKIPIEFKNKKSRCHGLGIRPDQTEIWSCNVEHKIVHVHDITKENYSETHQIPMIGRVYWLCFTPDSRYCFVAVRSEKKVCMVDCQTKKIVTHIDVGNTPKRNIVITLRD